VRLDPNAIRSAKEPPLFAIGAAVSAVAWILIAVSVIGLIYGAILAVFVLAAHALLIAQIKGNGVRLSERQLPELYARVEAAALKLGLPKVPEVYLVQSHGTLNAFATKLLSRNFIILYSSLVDSCEDPRQLDFIVGHELGHLAAGHLRYNAFLAPYRLMPWLGAAYSRAREYTCDRFGLVAAGDLEQSTRGLAVLAAGGAHAGAVDLGAFEAQRLETGSFWMSTWELSSTHPYLCKRVAALREYAQPGSVKDIGRNPLAYPLAPLLGAFGRPLASGRSPIATLFVVGLIAAIATQLARSAEPPSHPGTSPAKSFWSSQP
jgi:Zn-dependent protease with chaperone function